MKASRIPGSTSHNSGQKRYTMKKKAVKPKKSILGSFTWAGRTALITSVLGSMGLMAGCASVDYVDNSSGSYETRGSDETRYVSRYFTLNHASKTPLYADLASLLKDDGKLVSMNKLTSEEMKSNSLAYPSRGYYLLRVSDMDGDAFSDFIRENYPSSVYDTFPQANETVHAFDFKRMHRYQYQAPKYPDSPMTSPLVMKSHRVMVGPSINVKTTLSVDRKGIASNFVIYDRYFPEKSGSIRENLAFSQPPEPVVFQVRGKLFQKHDSNDSYIFIIPSSVQANRNEYHLFYLNLSNGYLTKRLDNMKLPDIGSNTKEDSAFMKEMNR